MMYSFTLKVTGINPNNEYYEDALHDAGCADALVAVVDGDLFLDFSRQAQSYELAVRSATDDVRKAGGLVVNVDRIS